MKKALFTFMAFTAISSITAHAETILSWDLAGVSSNTTSVTASANGLTGTITRGFGITTGNARSNAFGASGFGVNATSTDMSAAFTAGDYFQISIVADPGVTFSTDLLEYTISKDTSSNARGAWQYSTNGTTFSNIGSTFSMTGTGTAGKAITGMSVVGDELTELTLRIAFAGFNTTLSSGSSFFLLNNSAGANPIRLDGAVTPVPEPGTYAAIAGVLFLGLAAYRRRRK